MKRPFVLLFIIFVFLLIPEISSAQNQSAEEQKVPFRERIYFGGNFGLQFGNRTTFIEISPLLGYWMTSDLVLGAGPVYRYWRYNDGIFNVEDNQFGTRLFSRFYFLDNFFAHAEYEWLNLTDYRIESEPRTNINSFLAGGGYVQRVGRSAFFVMILYNFTESQLTPYDNPVFRAGFSVGL